MRIEKELRFKSGMQYYLQDGNIIYCVTYWDDSTITVRRTHILKKYNFYIPIDQLINSRKSITIFIMEKQQRIDKIKSAPDGSLFLVRAPNGMLWKQGDRGYTEDITEARQFSQQEIIDKLQANGFTDKSIEIFTPQQSI